MQESWHIGHRESGFFFSEQWGAMGLQTLSAGSFDSPSTGVGGKAKKEKDTCTFSTSSHPSQESNNKNTCKPCLETSRTLPNHPSYNLPT